MDYAQLITDTLAPLGLPIKEDVYTGTKPAYLTFTCYTEQAAAAAANKTVEREYGFMLNLYQKAGDISVDLNALKEQAIGLLESAGFDAVVARNNPDLENHYNRWTIDCSYLDNLQ